MRPLRSLNSTLPIFIFLVFLCIILAIWQRENRREIQSINYNTEIAAAQIKIKLEGFLRARIASLDLMADRWLERRPVDFSRERFLQFAETIYSRYTGFQSLHWVDPEGNIRWTYPFEAEITLIRDKKNIYRDSDPFVRKTIKAAEATGKRQISNVFKLIQGPPGFIICLPLIHNDTIQGYFLAGFSIPKIMDICIADNIFIKYVIGIYENNRLISHYGERRRPSGKRSPRQISKKIGFENKIWHLKIEPKLSIDKTTGSFFNLPFLFLGFFFSALLSLLSYLLFRRIDLYRQTKEQALQEVEERKRAEKEQKRLLSELSVKNEEMESFIYTVSHDLRSPIITIDGFAKALEEDFGEIIGKTGRLYTSRIFEGTRKMESLINDLLELSRIGRIVENKSMVSLADLAEEAIREFQPQIEERKIRIRIEADMPPLFGERKRLAQVVNNLISNAIRYIDKDNNPDPLIEVGALKTGKRPVYFVRDNGIGIDTRYFDRIFQIFQRLREAKAIEGTGVGLTIVKRIIENHGGRIWVESERGMGSTFFFYINEKGERQ